MTKKCFNYIAVNPTFYSADKACEEVLAYIAMFSKRASSAIEPLVKDFFEKSKKAETQPTVTVTYFPSLSAPRIDIFMSTWGAPSSKNEVSASIIVSHRDGHVDVNSRQTIG